VDCEGKSTDNLLPSVACCLLEKSTTGCPDIAGAALEEKMVKKGLPQETTLVTLEHKK
jgi:hypothetical protein